MPREVAKYLWDIDRAGRELVGFVEGYALQTYKNQPMLLAAVERKFEIVGDALAQMAIHHPDTLLRIPLARTFIGFRNILIYRYAEIVDELVWSVAQTSLVSLLAQVSDLLPAPAADVD